MATLFPEGTHAVARKPLTPKQQRFVDEYLVDLNATAAAERAGYHPKMAAKLVAKGSIQAAIQAAQADRAKATELTAEYVLRRLRKEARRTGEDASHGARVKALELLGKHLGLFPNKHEHSGAIPVQLEIVERLAVRQPAPANAGDPPPPGPA